MSRSFRNGEKSLKKVALVTEKNFFLCTIIFSIWNGKQPQREKVKVEELEKQK